MKYPKIIFVLIMLFCIPLISFGQTTRYFRFQACPESTYGNWQDTSFIAWTNDASVQNDVDAELALPFSNRSKFPSGTLTPGDGGFNCNAGFYFSWHLSSWQMVDFATEVCDACPYQDIELNPSYWIDTVGSFCGWSVRVAEEVNIAELDVRENLKYTKVFPNPVENTLNVQIPISYESVGVSIYSIIGEECYQKLFTFGDSIILDTEELSSGTYLLKLDVNGISYTTKFTKL